tara:strand:+ start:1607 stop:3649 length:2043 start_codon:yes stop_codon:yes gene_type:complete
MLKYISGLILLTLTILVTGVKAETTCVTNALGDRTCTTVTSGTTTGNILNNSTFGTGNTTTTTDWSTTGSDGVHTHGNFGTFPYQSGMDQTGGVLAFEGHIEDNVYQDQSLVGDGHLTKSQINEGFTSTQSADVWFWNSIENTLTLKQTITAADGTVTTQTRVLNDHDTNRPFNGGNFENYTNVYTQSANTQNDFTIRTELYNESASYQDSHRGPDVDNVQLSITTAGSTEVVITSCVQLGTCTTIGDDINDAVDLIDEDSGRPIFDIVDEDVAEAIEDFETIEINPITFVPEVEFEIIVEEDFGFTEIPFEEFIVDSFETFLETNDLTMDFQQELIIEDISEQEFFDELSDQMVEELGADMMTLVAPPDMMVEMEMPNDMAPIMTEQEMNDFVEANPDMIEFADENTIVLRPPSEMENNMPEMEEIKEEPMENITVAEAPEDVQGKPNMEETPNEEIITESPKEEVETSTETNTPREEEPNATTTEQTTETSTTEETLESNEETTDTRQESEVVSNESEMDENTETEGQEKTEGDGEIVQNKSDVSVKERGSVKTKADIDIGKKVARIIKKLEAKLKRVDDKIKATSYVLSVTLQNLQPDMGSYINKTLPDGKNLVGVPNDDFFDNINRIAQQQIYKDASLNAYTSNDPIAVHNRLLVEIDMKKQTLRAELAALRSLLK